MNNSEQQLPELPLEAWEQSKITLHLYTQIVGKIRLKLNPKQNHWWHITLYVSATGISSKDICYGSERFEINFNFIQHQLELHTSWGYTGSFALVDGLSVAAFYQQLFKLLEEAGIEVKIVDQPYDMGISQKFSEITQYKHYQSDYVQRFWKILRWTDSVFREFGSRFLGKTCPIHIYWHHLDLAVTRFSGSRAPELAPDATQADKEAYSHEVISFGFWAGDAQVREPAYYSYTYPSPAGLEEEMLKPEIANWIDSNGSPMAFMTYHDLIKTENPRQSLIDFLESAYQAGAKRSKWSLETYLP